MKLTKLFLALVFVASLLAPSLGWTQEKAKQKSPAQSETKKSTAKKVLIDINSASEDELKSIEGVGNLIAKKIVDNRPYKRKDELVKKKIVSENTYDQIKDQIIAKQTKEPGEKTSAKKPSDKK